MTTVYKLEKDLCRCCHAEGSFYNLEKPRYNLGHKEIYLEMLKTSLDIKLSPVPGDLSKITFTICEACVVRLRDAHNFRRQVELCEQRFNEMYKDVVHSLTTIDVKEELPGTFHNDVKTEIELEDDGFDIKFDDSDDDQPVINIKVEELTRPKAKAKPKSTITKSKIKKTLSKKNSKQSVADKSQEKKSVGDVNEKPRTGSRKLQKCTVQETDYRTEGDSYICAHCEKRYEKRFSLVFHIKTKHYKIPRYSCQYCKKTFMTPAPLTVHKLEEHNIDERFKCKACNAAFNTKVQLRKHINNFHMLGEKYKCEFCEYESFSFEGMYKHKFKHRTEKNFHCRFCRKSFLRKATLDLHERIHTGDRRKVCQVCGQAFVQKASLNYHMTKYHPEVNF